MRKGAMTRRTIGMQIFGEADLEEHVRHGGRVMSHCISIRNDHRNMPPRDPAVFGSFRAVLDLEFHDVEKREWLPPDLADAPIPEKGHILQTIGFVRWALSDPALTGFTIHCWRGVSRSSAIAAGIIYMVLRDEASTMHYLRRIRPQALPLPRILRLWDEVLGSDLGSHGAMLRSETLDRMRKQLMEDLWGSDDQLEELPVAE